MDREALRLLALRMRTAYEAVSPYIEKWTSQVCPSCRSVCCIDRHGTHEPLDLLFLRALGETPPPEPALHDDTRPCRHLGQLGCCIERWRRPYRCTWYFCEALLDATPSEGGSGRAYRDFMRHLGELQGCRHELSELGRQQP